MTEAALILSICAVAMAFVAIARSGGGRSGSAALTDVRLGRIERRLDEIARFSGAPATAAAESSGADGLSQTVRDYLAAGQKIQAIKQYRMETNVGLKEAKDAIDAAEAAGLVESSSSELKIDA